MSSLILFLSLLGQCSSESCSTQMTYQQSFSYTSQSSSYGRYSVSHQGRNIYVYGTKLADGNIMWFPDQQLQQSTAVPVRRATYIEGFNRAYPSRLRSDSRPSTPYLTMEDFGVTSLVPAPSLYPPGFPRSR